MCQLTAQPSAACACTLRQLATVTGPPHFSLRLTFSSSPRCAGPARHLCTPPDGLWHGRPQVGVRMVMGAGPAGRWRAAGTAFTFTTPGSLPGPMPLFPGPHSLLIATFLPAAWWPTRCPPLSLPRCSLSSTTTASWCAQGMPLNPGARLRHAPLSLMARCMLSPLPPELLLCLPSSSPTGRLQAGGRVAHLRQ